MNTVPIKIYPVNKEAEILMGLYPPVLANNFLPELLIISNFISELVLEFILNIYILFFNIERFKL